MVNHPGVDEFVFLEDLPTALRIPFDPFDASRIPCRRLRSSLIR
jgi:hypothetical protein